jgi:sugar phosphate isomerase/epimerase
MSKAKTDGSRRGGRCISLAAVTLREVPPDELAKAAAAAGFDAVGIRLSPWDPNHPVRYTADQLRRMATLIADLGIFTPDVEQIRLLPETSASDFEYLFEGAALLGARHALIYGDDPDEERFIAQLNQLGQIGLPYGVSPVVEFMPFTAVNTLAQALSILERADLPRPALLIDTLHLARSGGRAEDIAGVDPQILPFVHLADGPADPPETIEGRRHEAGHARQLPGHGQLPLSAYLRALPAGIALALEVPGASEGTVDERAAAAAKATRSLLAALEGDEI